MASTSTAAHLATQAADPIEFRANFTRWASTATLRDFAIIAGVLGAELVFRGGVGSLAAFELERRIESAADHYREQLRSAQ